jgi:perosamine synthetase
MGLLPSIEQLLVGAEKTLRDAGETIDANAQGVCFVVEEGSGKLAGVVTDGDLRRAILKGKSLTSPIGEVMQREFVSLPLNSLPEVIQRHLDERVTHIPLVDENGCPRDYACVNQFRRIQVAQPLLNGNELAYVTDCIRTNWISSQGSYVLRFEQMLGEYCNVPQALAVSNGTVAIHLALVTLGIGPCDEVIVPDLTFAASINTVLHAGATPVLVDIDPRTLNIDPKEIRKAITPKTRAIMPVHLYGQPCEMDEICAIAKENGLLVIEDCAESLGTLYKGRPVGSFGDAATFSFFGNKTITTGEGGAILFRDKAAREKAAVLRDHGMSKSRRYWHEFVGYNYRLTNLQAAIGVAQMERVSEFVSAKIRIAKRYVQGLQGVKGLELPTELGNNRHTHWLFTMLTNDSLGLSRDELIQRLLFNGIESRPVFYPLHTMPPYERFAGGNKLERSKAASTRGISLPSAVSLTDEEVDSICAAIRAITGARSLIQ